LTHIQNSAAQPLVIALVIDALDECESRDDAQRIFKLLAQAKTLVTVRLQVFITSRPDVDVILERQWEVVEEIKLHPDHKSNDITIFFKKELKELRDRYEQKTKQENEQDNPNKKPLPADWPGAEIVEELVKRAEGLFIYAKTVCLFIDYRDMHLNKCLSEILNVGAGMPLPLSHLDNIYKQVLNHSVNTEFNEQCQQKLYSRFKSVVGSFAVLLDRLPAAALFKMIMLPFDEVSGTLRRLRSVLDVPEDQKLGIRLIHTSFRDYLLDKKRCPDRFWVNEAEAHQFLLRSV
jgi:hypothetical protein